MGKHTQGEWIARPDPSGSANDWCIGLNDDVSPVDLVAVCHERDARLIAAAPDLLSALIDVRDNVLSDSPDMWARVAEAIRKATGETM